MSGPAREPGDGSTMDSLKNNTVKDNSSIGASMEELVRIMSVLRSPEGCPWDREQTPGTLSRHIIEEAYETVEAIETEEWKHLAEELGDLLLQIVFQAQIAQEKERFDIQDVISGIIEKLVRRHPHVFGSAKVETAEEVTYNWERIKREEEGKISRCGATAGIPELAAAMEIQKYAAKSGFDWGCPGDVIVKLEEETRELEEALKGPPETAELELGDILFTVVNVARHLGIDPSRALRRTNRKFVSRYSHIEEKAKSMGKSIDKMTIAEMNEVWEEAKRKGSKDEKGEERG